MKFKWAIFASLALLLSGCVSIGGSSPGNYYNVTEYDEYSYDRGYHGPRPLFDEFIDDYPGAWSAYERQACYWEGRYCEPFGSNRFRYGGGHRRAHFDFYIASYPRYFSVSECLWYSRDPWPCYSFAFWGYDSYYFDRYGHHGWYRHPSLFYHAPYPRYGHGGQRRPLYQSPRPHPRGPGLAPQPSIPVTGTPIYRQPEPRENNRRPILRPREPIIVRPYPEPRDPVERIVRPEPPQKIRDDSRMHRMPVVREDRPAPTPQPVIMHIPAPVPHPAPVSRPIEREPNREQEQLD